MCVKYWGNILTGFCFRGFILYEYDIHNKERYVLKKKLITYNVTLMIIRDYKKFIIYLNGLIAMEL